MITAVVLAAGTGSRLGRTKQLIELGGKPLVQHVVDAAAAAGVGEIVVVVGHDAERVASALRLPRNARTVINADYERGQAASLAVGLGAAASDSEGAIVLLADQPGIAAEVIERMVQAFRAGRARVVRARFDDGPGPSLLSREVWSEASRLEGDTGARALIDAHPDWVEEVAFSGTAPRDVDTPEDLSSLR